MAAFSLELANKIQGNPIAKVCGLVTKEEGDLLTEKLRRIYKRSIDDGLGALRSLEKERL